MLGSFATSSGRNLDASDECIVLLYPCGTVPTQEPWFAKLLHGGELRSMYNVLLLINHLQAIYVASRAQSQNDTKVSVVLNRTLYAN
jgi:hypothetical protein